MEYSQTPRPDGSRWWAPRRLSWWIAVLFIIGSACFAVAPFPGFVQLVGAGADAAVFFAGSLFFTAAAALQYLETVNADRVAERRRLRVFGFEPRRIDWWAAVIQLAGTLFFNVSTFEALQDGLSTAQENRLIWAPDVFGCACFLVASGLAWAAARGWIAGLNLAGSVAFALAGAASYFVPETGEILDLAAANFTTVIGALCFLAGAVGLLVVDESCRSSP